MVTCSHSIFKVDRQAVIKKLGADVLLSCLKQMLLIRNFEIRAESAYQQGKVGGFFHCLYGSRGDSNGCVAGDGTEQLV